MPKHVEYGGRPADVFFDAFSWQELHLFTTQFLVHLVPEFAKDEKVRQEWSEWTSTFFEAFHYASMIYNRQQPFGCAEILCLSVLAPFFTLHDAFPLLRFPEVAAIFDVVLPVFERYFATTHYAEIDRRSPVEIRQACLEVWNRFLPQFLKNPFLIPVRRREQVANFGQDFSQLEKMICRVLTVHEKQKMKRHN